MAAFRKDLCDLIRPETQTGKLSGELVKQIDDILDRAGVARDDGGPPSAPKATGSASALRKELTDLIRPHLAGGKFSDRLVQAIDSQLDRAGVPRDSAQSTGASAAKPAQASNVSAAAVPPGRLDVAGLRSLLGLSAAGAFDQQAKDALLARLANPKAPSLSDADFDRAAADLNVPAKHIKAVRKVEVREAPFNAEGRPTILYERHVFARNTVPKGRFNGTHPAISGGPYGKGGYGSKSAQYGKLADACALDPEAAFSACSWGAFQVLGEHGRALGYGSAVAMGFALTASEAAHLDCFLRFLRVNGLVDKLRACRAGDAKSCIPFVRGYNGKGFAEFDYHNKLAKALL